MPDYVAPAFFPYIDLPNTTTPATADDFANPLVRAMLDVAGPGGRLSQLELDAGVVAAPDPVLYARGVNLAGAEFAPAAATLPGVYGTDYAYPAVTEIEAMAARGHTVIRLPFRWERIQPTRLAELDATELARLHTTVDRIRAAGMTTILDVHNYARYIQSVPDGGATLVLGDTLDVADLTDLWGRLSAEFRADPGVYAYGLMNEPHDLVAVAGTFAGTVRYAFASGTGGWAGESTASVSNSSGKLRATDSLGSGSVNIRVNDAGTVSGGSTPTGTVLRVEATPVALPAGTWTVKSQWMNSSFSYQEPVSTVLTRMDTGAVVTSLTVGQAVYVTCTFSTIDSPPNVFALEIDGTGASAGTVTVDFDNFSQGSAVGGSTGAQVWEDAAQDCVTAIRANNDETLIMVPGYGYSGAQTWPVNHPAGPWITDTADNVRYEAHYYFDSDNSGVYADDYATEQAAATGGLVARMTRELNLWLGWLDSYNVGGFLGEFGWPNTSDTAAWNAVGEQLYQLLDGAQCDATYWTAGARWGSGYLLSAYTGTDQDTVKSQAVVIEAHRTVTTDATDLAARIHALEQAATPRAAPPHKGPAFMVLGADTASELATAAANGATHALVEVFWDRVQSSAGGDVDATDVIANIDAAIAAGLKVCLRLSPQYPPAFALSGVPKFKQQSTAVWSGTPGNGDEIRDWVWTRTGRNYLADFAAKLFAQLDMSRVERMQIGGLRSGELSLPVSDGTVWWFFGAAAQSGTDLAPRMAVCPVPATTPSTGTTWTNNDRLLIGWLSQSMTNYMRWWIEQHRSWFDGPIWVLHPGFGLRTYMDPAGTGALAYREMHANGLDWAAQIGSYPDANVHPYSTDVAAAHPGAQIYSDVNDGDAAGWLHLIKVARRMGRNARHWGENTGGDTNTTMNAVFASGAIPHGYEGIGWLSHDSLATGSDDTYANWAAKIGATR